MKVKQSCGICLDIISHMPASSYLVQGPHYSLRIPEDLQSIYGIVRCKLHNFLSQSLTSFNGPLPHTGDSGVSTFPVVVLVVIEARLEIVRCEFNPMDR